jgi:transcription termination factor NusA
MDSGKLSQAIREMINEKNISQELVLNTIRDFIRAAYKRKYGTDENVQIKFSDDLDNILVSAEKTVVAEEDYYHEVTQIPLDEAQELVGDNVEIGDTLLIPIDINTFDRGSVQSAKQKAQQSFKEIKNSVVYSTFKVKEHTLMTFEVSSFTPNHDIICKATVNGETSEAILPYRNQSPRENYSVGDEIRCYVESVEKPEIQPAIKEKDDRRGRRNKKDVSIVLSRTSAELVRKLLEIQVPEIAQHQVEIVAIARQAGARTKIAVKSNREGIDPIGSTIGLRGVRIQAVIAEIYGEKIDVIAYDENPLQFIANALTPATVSKIIPLDLYSKSVVAIVEDNQLGIAIGNGGVNVKLAKQLCDWMIDVKTQAEFDEMEINVEAKEKAEALFSGEGDEKKELSNSDFGVSEEETLLSALPIEKELVDKLNFHDVYSVEEYCELSEDELKEFGVTDEERESIERCIDYEDEQEEQFVCPECGQVLSIGTTKCPNCGVEFEFE